MLNAGDFDELMLPITDLYERYMQSVIGDIARRISKMGAPTPTAAWQLQRLTNSGAIYEETLKKIAALTGVSEQELSKAFQLAGVKGLRFDDSIYRKAGLNPLPLNMSPALVDVLKSGIEKTQHALMNFTRTTALTAQQSFLDTADLVYTQVINGTMDYNSAIRQAVQGLSDNGLKTIAYGSGAVDQLDVAMRRAVLTGIGQTHGQLQWARADEMGQDLVQVSSHYGARPAHAEWQGGIYSRSGTDPNYGDFVEKTGYGTGGGLNGYNCRHSWFPYFKGISEAAYKRAEIAENTNKTVTLGGRQVSVYEATQQQRHIERQIRFYKRRADTLGVAGLDNSSQIGFVRKWQETMRSFVDETGLPRQSAREGIAKITSISSIQKDLAINLDGIRASQAGEQIIASEGPKLKGGSLSSERVTIIGEGTDGLLKLDYIEGQQFGDEIPTSEGFAKREVIAYKIDEMLELDIVPKTTAFVENGEYKSLQRLVPGDKPETFYKGIGNEYKVFITDRGAPGKMSILDIIMANEDRFTTGNMLFSNRKLFATDNGLSLLSSYKGTAGYVGDVTKNYGRSFLGFPQSVDKFNDFKMFVPKRVRDKLKEALESGELEKLLRTPEYGIPDKFVEGALGRAKTIVEVWDDRFFDVVETIEEHAAKLVAPVPVSAENITASSVVEVAAGKVGNTVRNGLSLIEQVHDLPATTRKVTTQMRKVPIGENTLGDFTRGFGPRIRIVTSADEVSQARTFIHEFGHFIDNQVFYPNNVRSYATEMANGLIELGKVSKKTRGEIGGDLLEQFMLKVKQTKAYESLQRIKDGTITSLSSGGKQWAVNAKHAKYLLEPPELWARAYEQYIATKTNSAALLETIDKGAKGAYKRYWSTEEFLPIMKEMDKVFDQLGLLK